MDGGIHLVRSLRGWHHPVIFSPSSKNSDEVPVHTYTVYGANCFESDILAEEIKPVYLVQLDDLFIIGATGGYDIPSANVWTRPAPAIYGIYHRKIVLLRHEQTIQEVRQYHHIVL